MTASLGGAPHVEATHGPGIDTGSSQPWHAAPGLVAGLAAATAVGTIDGIVAAAVGIDGSRSPSLAVALVLHSIAVVLPLGMAWGIVQELVLRAGRHSSWCVGIASHLRPNPRVWFARNAPVARAVGAFFIAGWTSVLLLLWGLPRIAAAAREPQVAALGSLAALGSALAVAGVVGLLAWWPLGWVVARAGRVSSAGAMALAVGGLAVWPAAIVLRPYSAVFEALTPLMPLLMLAAAGVGCAMLLAGLFTRRVRAARRWLTVVATTGALALFVASGLVLGGDQRVLSTLLLRTAMARRLVGPLQRAVDRDGDGYGAWFGGGDCNDRDPRVHPRARDVPDNGVDENCSGADGTASRAPIAPPLEVAPLAQGAASIVFVSIDAVRPDHASVYGYDRETTPNLALFARRAVRFDAAYTTSPQSVRSLASVFTGRYASTLAWHADGRFPRFESSNTTLAELLRAAGFSTAAFLNTSYFSLTPGFFQGFDVVQEGSLFKDDAVLAVSRATAWLNDRRRRERPFFAWLHLIDPHAPYRDLAAPQDFGHEDIDRYDEEIARADAALGPLFRVFDAFERDGKPLLVVVFADHGEAFGEHGRLYHADDLHDEVLRVPLLVRGPGIRPGTQRGLASLLDLHATALTFAGLPVPRGVSSSLAPMLLRPDACSARTPCARAAVRAELESAYASDLTMRALVVPPWKLIHDVGHGAWELYDLRRDPKERRNVHDAYPSRAASMRSLLDDAP